MSVVVGLIRDRVVAIIADTRRINLKTGEVESEDEKKIFRYSANVAIGVSGNAALCKLLLADLQAIKNESNKVDLRKMTTTAMAAIINILIDNMRKLDFYTEELPLNVMVAGKDVFGALEIQITNNLSAPKWKKFWAVQDRWVPAIFNPKDVPHDECLKLLANLITSNYSEHPVNIGKSFVEAVNERSKSVGPRSDFWFTSI